MQRRVGCRRVGLGLCGRMQRMLRVSAPRGVLRPLPQQDAAAHRPEHADDARRDGGGHRPGDHRRPKRFMI